MTPRYARPSAVRTILHRAALAPLAALVLLAPQSALAQPILVDFELIPGMTNGPGLPIPIESRLSDQYLATHGVRFSSGSAFVAVVIHGPGTPSGTRIIGGSNPAGSLTYQNTNPIVAEFLDPSGTQPMVVSVVSVRGDLNPIPGTKTLEAYDVNGQLIGSQTLQDSDTAPLMISAPGIHRVRMHSQSATIGFDDLRFDTPTSAHLCPADFNQDGGIDGADVEAFFIAWEAGQPAADVNTDGGIDGADVESFFEAWEAGGC